MIMRLDRAASAAFQKQPRAGFSRRERSLREPEDRLGDLWMLLADAPEIRGVIQAQLDSELGLDVADACPASAANDFLARYPEADPAGVAAALGVETTPLGRFIDSMIR